VGSVTSKHPSHGTFETLATSLSQLSNSRFMARGTVFTYKGQQVDSRNAGHNAKVDSVVYGSVTELSDTLIAQVAPIEVEGGAKLLALRGKYINLKAGQDAVLTILQDNRSGFRSRPERAVGDEALRAAQSQSASVPAAPMLRPPGRGSVQNCTVSCGC
jgi:hypothetical protein